MSSEHNEVNALLSLARRAAEMAGLDPSDGTAFDEAVQDAAKEKPDDFFEPHGDEPEIRFMTGEDDAAALAGRSKKKLKVLRAVALALLSVPDTRKLLAVLCILKAMQGKRQSVKFDDAVNDLLRAWGGFDVSTLDAAGPALIGALCWRMAETHSVKSRKLTIRSIKRAKRVALIHAKGRTWDKMAKKMGINGDALKKSQHARRKKQGPRVREE